MSKPRNERPAAETAPSSTESDAAQWAAEAEKLRERLVFLCTDFAPDDGTYAYLEKRTGIGASKWKNLFLRRQFPTIEMLLAMCHFRPYYTQWLMSGSAPERTGLAQDQFAPSPGSWQTFHAYRDWIAQRKAKESFPPGSFDTQGNPVAEHREVLSESLTSLDNARQVGAAAGSPPRKTVTHPQTAHGVDKPTRNSARQKKV